MHAHRSLMRVLSIAFSAALFSGCNGGGHNAMLPAGQTNGPISAGSLSAREMNVLFPKSQSPASFKVAPMQLTAKQPASAMASLPRAIAPKSIGSLTWSQVPGAATSLPVGTDGSLWALSTLPAGANKYLWHYSNGTWTNVPGSASSIAVGHDGTLYAVNSSSGGVYGYNGASWSSLGGGANWVAAGADGSVYVLSNGGAASGDSAIWKYQSGVWTQQPGSGSQLAGSPDPNTYAVPGVGTIAPNGYFVLTSSGSIYYYSPGTGYVRFPSAASGIAPVLGGLFALNYPPSASGEGLSYFDYGLGSWTAEPGSGVSVAAGPGSGGTGTQLYVVSAAGAIWTTPVVSAGKIYVTNIYNNTVTTYNADGTQTTPTITTGLNEPVGIAVDASGKIYVTNWGNSTLTTYTADGTQTTPTITTGLNIPSGVAVDGAGKIYVTNLGNGTVTAYNANGTQTKLAIMTIQPHGVAVDAAGKIYVAQGNNTVTTYNADGTQTTPTITTGLNVATGVAVDPAGKIYVTSYGAAPNYGISTLTTYTANGTQTDPTITAGLSGSLGVALDAAGKIYVANYGGALLLSGSITTYNANGIQTIPTITAGVVRPEGVAVH